MLVLTPYDLRPLARLYLFYNKGKLARTDWPDPSILLVRELVKMHPETPIDALLGIAYGGLYLVFDARGFEGGRN